MNEKETGKKPRTLARSRRALVNNGIEELFKTAGIKALLVERLLKDYALAVLNKEKTEKEAIQKFKQWQNPKVIKTLSVAAQRVLFLLQNNYNVNAILQKHSECSTALRELIHRIVDAFYNDFQKVQNKPAGAVSRNRAARLQKQQLTEKDRLFRNISLN